MLCNFISIWDTIRHYVAITIQESSTSYLSPHIYRYFFQLKEQEIELLKARVISLETELQLALSKPGGAKNQEVIENIKQQHAEVNINVSKQYESTAKLQCFSSKSSLRMIN